MKVLDNPFAIANNILQIIKDSKKFLYLVSPYIQFETNESTELKLIKDAIFDSLEKNIDLKFITKYPNKTTLKYLENFTDKGAKVRFINKLHSKVYCNESKALITSMNLILISILHNNEIGILLTKDSETNEFNKIISYVEELIKKKRYFKQKNAVKVDNQVVYILKLENHKWYVGKTSKLDRRLEEHKKGYRSPWTQINKIISVEKIIKNGDLKSITLDYMRKYGWENVRGYAWSQWNMKRPPKELRTK